MKEIKLQLQPILWTKHAKVKLREYGLSESRTKRVLRHPDRVVEGVAPKTLACMQRVGSSKHPYEIWVMYVEIGEKRKVVSAWRYPGITKVEDPVPLPEDINI